jgi:hypothetical protein
MSDPYKIKLTLNIIYGLIADRKGFCLVSKVQIISFQTIHKLIPYQNHIFLNFGRVLLLNNWPSIV